MFCFFLIALLFYPLYDLTFLKQLPCCMWAWPFFLFGCLVVRSHLSHFHIVCWLLVFSFHPHSWCPRGLKQSIHIIDIGITRFLFVFFLQIQRVLYPYLINNNLDLDRIQILVKITEYDWNLPNNIQIVPKEQCTLFNHFTILSNITLLQHFLYELYIFQASRSIIMYLHICVFTYCLYSYNLISWKKG